MEPKVTTLPDTLKLYPLGWKAKLGFLAPSHDTGWGSYEFQIMAPEGVVPLETRVPAHTLALDQLRDIVTLAHEHPEADGVFCCGGCFRTVGVVAEIERECGIPVVGTQQANMWNCLRMGGVNDRLEGFGTLPERPRL